MEWREQSTVSCDVAFAEAQRWVEEVTRKTFGGKHFRSALENGVLLCDLINKIKPGIIKRVNRLSTPIAGLDNINVFLKACGKLGLKEAQLFHPGDLQDLSSRVTVNQEETSRRLKNVLITIYWLGRKAQVDPFYNGPHLNLKAFEGLLGIALSKALEESSGPKRSVRDSGFGDGWYAEREDLYPLQSAHRREASLDSLDSEESRTLSISSEATLKGSSEGCTSDTEADHRSDTMADSKDLLQFRRSQAIEPRTTTQFNQFLPSKDKPAAYVPAPLRKKRAERREDTRRSWASPMYAEEDGTFTSGDTTGADSRPQNGYDTQPSVHHCSYKYESESDSDLERPEPDLVLDDLASRRFRSPPPVIPANYAVPSGLPSMATVPKAPQNSVAFLSSALPSPPPSERRTTLACVVPRQPCYDSEEDDDEDEVGYADPVQDDLYTRKIGMPPLSSAKAPYDKFLPKYWTPEEEAHVQRIKLGSQRRPWYRKMQGFSQKSGSSSDDSDTDIAPWLVPAPPIQQQLDMATSNQSTSGGHTPPQLTTRSPHMQQYTVILPHTTQPQLGFPRPDPTSGPRVVRCAKASIPWSRYPSEPHGAAQDVLPDLENDDMFARRTRSFHSSIDLISPKPESRISFAAPSWLEASIVTQPRRGEHVIPDIERDDLVFRKFNQPKTEQPLSGAPDVYHAVPVPEPWSLPTKLQARLLCTPCPPEHREETRGREGKCREHVTSDDMLLRRLGVGQPQGAGHPSPAAQPVPRVPSSCSDADMNKWQAIREASRLRYKKKLLVERLLQKRSGRDGSKSVDDIPESSVLRQVHYEDLQRIRAQVKECEDKWQDDLTRWKNRRRSINSDIVRKKEEREQMELIASGSSTRRSRTFGEMQEERDSREQDTLGSNSNVLSSSSVRDLGSNSNALSSSSVRDPASEIRPFAKIQLGQNYTINTAPTQGPDAPALQSGPTQQPYAPALPSDSPTSLSDGPAPLMSAPPSSVQNSTYWGADTKRPGTSTPISSSFSNRILAAQPAERSPSPPYVHHSMEAKAGAARVSVSLPRSFQRSDGSRLTSVVTPRPFGTQATRISSLPRSFIMDDSHRRFNGEAGAAHRSSVPSRYSQFLTSEDEARSQSSSVQSSNEDEEEEEEHQEELGPPPPPPPPSNAGTGEVVPQPTLVSQLSATSDGDVPQEYYSDMRISLNQKPNSSRDFGFQTSWDSTGARVKSVQPGSPAELCRLQVGDVILAVSGRHVSDMSYDEWKGSLEAALQQGSLVMDIRRHGKTAWDREPPSLPLKSQKTINLTSVGPTLVGGPEKHVGCSSERNSGTSPAETAAKAEERRTQPVNDLPAKGVNGGFRDESVAMRNKEYESISLRNLKRRSEFFEQKGGSDSAISDLQVPSLSTTSNRWSWDPEEERKRQEKWQKEQERLLQEKYKRDQEKLEEEWQRAQQEVTKEDSGSKEDEKMPQLGGRSSITLSSYQVPLSESTSPSLEEDQWETAKQQEQEEKEPSQQEQEEEWRQKEQEEWRERQEEEERRQPQRVEKEPESPRLQEEEEEQQQQQWEKSKSTPELDDVDKPARRVSSGEGTWSRDSQRKRSTPLSQAELERQQILQEMKKKTQLLTDSSWIRQRSTSVVNKEPINPGGHIRRGESLDNLDSARPWRPLSWSSVSASSAPSYSRPHSSLSTLSSASSMGYARSGAATLPSSYSTGSLRQSPWSQLPSTSPTSLGTPPGGRTPESQPPAQQRTSASAASPTSGVPSPEPRSESETDSSTATPATSESKAVSPLPCDLALQQIEEEAN